MKIINVKNEIYTCPQTARKTPDGGWVQFPPEPFYPETLKEKLLHWLGFHYTFSETNQPYCVVCLKKIK